MTTRTGKMFQMYYFKKALLEKYCDIKATYRYCSIVNKNMSSLRNVEVMGEVSIDLANIISFSCKKSFHNALNVPE